MNYVLLNPNGSVQESSLDDYIQRGSDKANRVKVAFTDSRRDGLAARLHCGLPNGTQIALVGTADYFEYKGAYYLGWDIPLTLASTIYSGELSCSLTVTDQTGAILVQYPFNLSINESAYPLSDEDWETRLTLDEYNQLFAYIQSIKGDIVVVDSYEHLPATGFEKTLYVVKKGDVAEGYVWKNAYLKLTDRDFALQCLQEAKDYTDHVAEATLESANDHADEVAQYQANQERERAISEEERIEAKLDNEISERESEISRVDSRIDDEESMRIAGDDSLKQYANEQLALKENLSNKTESIGADSTNSQYPSAKAVNDFVNSSINSLAAYYITKNAQGDAFETYAELSSATLFYSGGEARTPTRNDYCIVRSDENHSNATTRYTYNNGWEYQYTVNDEPFTQAQLNAINSGITSTKVASYDQGLADILARVRYSDAVITGGFIDGFNISGVYRNVAQTVSLTPDVTFVQSISDLPSQNDGRIYFVLDNDTLYRYSGNNWVDVGIYNPMNYVTTFTDQLISGTKSIAMGKGIIFQSLAAYLELKSGLGGLEIWNRSGGEAELYEINQTGIRPFGERDLGSETRKWENLYVKKINGRDTSKLSTIQVEDEEYSYQIKIVGGKPQLHYEKI